MADVGVDPPGPLLAGIAARATAADRGDRDLSADVEALRGAGLLAAPLSPEAGGPGLGTTADGALAAVRIFRRLGRANLAVARLFEGHVNAVKLVLVHGDGAVRRRTFAAVREGALLAVWGADGDDPVRLARREGRLVLFGEKRFASGLGLVGAALVTAGTDAGPQLVLVPADDPLRADAADWTLSGMRATRSGRYVLEGMAVPAEAAVGAPGDLLREPHFEGGTWRYAAAHAGGAEALFGAVAAGLRARGRERHPVQEMRLGEAAIACETARLWVERAAVRVEADGDRDAEGAAAYALFAREATEAACRRVIDLSAGALGTGAFAAGEPVERIRRDLDLFIRQAAPDAKRSRAVSALLARDGLPEDL